MFIPEFIFGTPYQITIQECQSYNISVVTHLSPFFPDSYFSTTYNGVNTMVITRYPLENPNTTFESLKTIFQNYKPEWKFSVADIRKLGGGVGKTRQIGLRHLSSEDAAIYEQKMGMQYGCSLNITFGKTEDSYSSFENLNTKSDAEIEELLPQYEDGINYFIFNSIYFH